MIDRTIPPAFVIPQSYTLPKVETIKLENGIPIHLLLSGIQPVLRVELIFRAGTWYETHSGASFFSCKMLVEGTSKYTSKEIQELYSYYGAFTELSSGQDNVSFTIYTLSRYLKEVLELTYHLITEATFPEEELENLKTIQSQQIKVNLEKNAYLATIAFREAIFGSAHPYGTSLGLESVENINRENITNHFEKFLCLSNCEIFISGFAERVLIDEINHVFGKKDIASSIAATEKKSIHQTIQKRKLILKENALQSSIRIGKRLFTITHEDYFKMIFLNEILGGYFGSRLMQNIREDKGYTYGIQSLMPMYLHEGYFMIATDVKRAYTLHTIEEIYKEINKLKTQPVPPEELETVRNYLLGTFLTSTSSPFAAIDKFKTIHFNGLDYSFYDRYFSALKNITAEDLMYIANLYFTDDLVEVIVGGEQ